MRVGERNWRLTESLFEDVPLPACNSTLITIPTASRFLFCIRCGKCLFPRILFTCWAISARMKPFLWKKSPSFLGMTLELQAGLTPRCWGQHCRTLASSDGERKPTPHAPFELFQKVAQKRVLPIFQNTSVSLYRQITASGRDPGSSASTPELTKPYYFNLPHALISKVLLVTHDIRTFKFLTLINY